MSWRIHDCYVCGKSEPWSDSWFTYGSLKVCSQACKDKLPDVEAVYDAEVEDRGRRPRWGA